jgi:hypothetical protein
MVKVLGDKIGECPSDWIVREAKHWMPKIRLLGLDTGRVAECMAVDNRMMLDILHSVGCFALRLLALFISRL